MIKSWLLTAVVVIGFSVMTAGQNPTGPAYVSPDPMANISNQMTRVSSTVAALSKTLKDFVDKFEKVGGVTFNEKQQKLILGMELLSRAEARVVVLQKSQIELVEKQNEVRSKLSQVDIDLRPRNIERSVALAGTTEADELRENRQARLQSERTSLGQLMQQIQVNLAETTDGLRDAQALVFRLRKMFLPQIERELVENSN
jgi:hypothetical protein